MTPHFAYPLMVLLSVLLLPALILMPATNTGTMLLVDLPLCIGTTGSLARVLRDGRGRAGPPRASTRCKTLPALLALGAGLAPHLSKAVFEGLRSMSGEFVRTPKHGDDALAPLPRARRHPDGRDRALPALVRERRRLARDGPLVRDAVRDALHDRLRLRRDARRQRAARAPQRRRVAALPGTARSRASSRASRRPPPSAAVRGARGLKTPQKPAEMPCEPAAARALSAGRRSISRLLSDTCERWRGPRAFLARSAYSTATGNLFGGERRS